MERLYEENITGEILKHMWHSEDLVELGPKGGKLVYETFVDIFETLKGNTPKGSSKIKLKLDGSPAVVSASNYYGKKFVALKHSWDKGKIFETPEAIKIEYGERPELANKLINLFNNLDFINIPQNEIWMGDYLFSKADLQTINLDGVECVTFQPNTIVYAIPIDDPIANLINRADIGVAWHTKYTGPDFQNLKISFDVSVSNVNSIPSVYQMDAKLPNMAGKLTLTSEESESVAINLNHLKSSIDSLYPKINDILANENLVSLINTYRNAIIKNFDNPNQFPEINGFKQWLETRKNKEKDTKKTDKGKNAVEERYNNFYQFIDSNIEGINDLWDTQKQIVGLKELFESKLNHVSHLKSYVNHISQGYIPTSGEGYAVSDIDGNVQKLVSRLEFSRNNFDNKNILKGWSSDRRMAESSALKKFKEDALDRANDIMNDLKASTETEDKKEPVVTFKGKLNQKITFTIQPTKGSEEKRDSKADSAESFLFSKGIRAVKYRGGNNGTTPIISFDINEDPDEESEGSSISVVINFKNRDGVGKPDRKSTENDEVYWAYCLSIVQNKNGEGLPKSVDDLKSTNLSFLGLPDRYPNLNNLNGYVEGSKYFCKNYLLPNKKYYFFREDKVINTADSNSLESLHQIIDMAASIIKGHGYNKNNWNPSDIYACESSSYKRIEADIRCLIHGSESNGSFNSINNYLLDKLKEKTLLGISLKNIEKGKTPKCNYYNLDPNTPIETKHFDISSIIIPSLSLASQSNGKASGMSINATSNSESMIFNYRIFSGKSLQGDLVRKGASAIDGKIEKYAFNEIYKNYGGSLLTRELNSAESEDVLLNHIETLKPKLDSIEESVKNKHLPLNNFINYSSFINFIQKINIELLKKDIKDNDSDTASRDYRMVLQWPRIIDFVYLISLYYGIDNNIINTIMDTLYRSATKNFPECAPFIKLHEKLHD